MTDSTIHLFGRALQLDMAFDRAPTDSLIQFHYWDGKLRIRAWQDTTNYHVSVSCLHPRVAGNMLSLDASGYSIPNAEGNWYRKARSSLKSDNVVEAGYAAALFAALDETPKLAGE